MNATVSTSKSVIRLRLVGGGRAIVSAALLKPWVPSSPSCRTAAAISSVPCDAATASQQQEKERGLGWSQWLLFLPGGLTFGLGTWQIFRRQDKVKMLEYRQMRLSMEPMKFNDASPSTEDVDALEFRKVACKGVFDEKKSIYVGPRSRSISGVTENGYYVIMPLMPVPSDPDSVQSPILVNRGWVPRSWRDKHLEVLQHVQEPSDQAPLLNQKSKQSSWWSFWSKKSEHTEVAVPTVTSVEVVGVVRSSEKPSIFVPENDQSSGQWFFVDVPAVARACGFPENTIYVEEINENVNPSCPYPIPKDINALIHSSVMPQDHLNYTLTWYSLSAAVTFMAYKRLKQRKS